MADIEQLATSITNYVKIQNYFNPIPDKYQVANEIIIFIRYCDKNNMNISNISSFVKLFKTLSCFINVHDEEDIKHIIYSYNKVNDENDVNVEINKSYALQFLSCLTTDVLSDDGDSIFYNLFTIMDIMEIKLESIYNYIKIYDSFVDLIEVKETFSKFVQKFKNVYNIKEYNHRFIFYKLSRFMENKDLTDEFNIDAFLNIYLSIQLYYNYDNIDKMFDSLLQIISNDTLYSNSFQNIGLEYCLTHCLTDSKSEIIHHMYYMQIELKISNQQIIDYIKKKFALINHDMNIKLFLDTI